MTARRGAVADARAARDALAENLEARHAEHVANRFRVARLKCACVRAAEAATVEEARNAVASEAAAERAEVKAARVVAAAEAKAPRSGTAPSLPPGPRLRRWPRPRLRARANTSPRSRLTRAGVTTCTRTLRSSRCPRASGRRSGVRGERGGGGEGTRSASGGRALRRGGCRHAPQGGRVPPGELPETRTSACVEDRPRRYGRRR